MLRNSKGQFEKGGAPWHKGLTKAEDPRLPSWPKGVPRSEDTKRKLSEALRIHYTTPDALRREYWINQKNKREIAEELGCSESTVIDRMKEWGIPARPRGQITRIVNQKRMEERSKTINWTSELQNYVDGLLLSDGHINKHVSKYSQSFALRYRGWAEQIHAFFSLHGIDSKISRPYTNEKGHQKIYLNTRVYHQFRNERTRWYPNGEKAFPPDLDFSSRWLLLNWYLGDGSLGRQPKRRSFAVLCVRKPKQDVREWLSEQLNEVLGIESTPCKRTINLKADGTLVFMDYIKDLPIPTCFQYKFDL